MRKAIRKIDFSKYLLAIPSYILAYMLSFYLLLYLPGKLYGCQGFGCFGLIFVVPYWAVFTAIPLGILIYFLFSKLPGLLAWKIAILLSTGFSLLFYYSLIRNV